MKGALRSCSTKHSLGITQADPVLVLPVDPEHVHDAAPTPLRRRVPLPQPTSITDWGWKASARIETTAPADCRATFSISAWYGPS